MAKNSDFFIKSGNRNQKKSGIPVRTMRGNDRQGGNEADIQEDA